MQDLRRMMIRAGPSRWWYAVGAAVWVLGFTVTYAQLRLGQPGFETAATGFQRTEPGQVLTVKLDEPARWSFWLEEPVGSDRTADAAKAVTGGVQLLRSFDLVNANDTDLPMQVPHAGDYTITVNGSRLRGWEVGEVDLPKGTYRASSQIAGFGVAGAPTPAEELGGDFHFSWPAVGGLAICAFVAWSRRRVNKSLLVAGG